MQSDSSTHMHVDYTSTEKKKNTRKYRQVVMLEYRKQKTKEKIQVQNHIFFSHKLVIYITQQNDNLFDLF